MMTVAEIKRAIERLPAKELEMLAEWFDEYRAASLASAEVFRLLDAEESDGGQGRVNGERRNKTWLVKRRQAARAPKL